jgi:hypothetical protein
MSGRKREGKRHLGKPSHRWHIKMDLKETGWEGIDWIHLAQDKEK